MKSILLVKKLLGLVVEMMPGLVNASFSLPDCTVRDMILKYRYNINLIKVLNHVV